MGRCATYGLDKPPTGLLTYQLMTGRAMQFPHGIVIGGEEVGPVRDRIRKYVVELSGQLKGMRQQVRRKQEES